MPLTHASLKRGGEGGAATAPAGPWIILTSVGGREPGGMAEAFQAWGLYDDQETVIGEIARLEEGGYTDLVGLLVTPAPST